LRWNTQWPITRASRITLVASGVMSQSRASRHVSGPRCPRPRDTAGAPPAHHQRIESA
jgi:hypothetical protein